MKSRMESTMWTAMPKIATQTRKAKVTMMIKGTGRSIVTKWMMMMRVTMVMTVKKSVCEENGDRDRMGVRGVNVGLMREFWGSGEVEARTGTVKDEFWESGEMVG